MHELLDAIAYLFDLLLAPFDGKSEPGKKWMKIAGLAIALLGMLSFLGLIVWVLL